MEALREEIARKNTAIEALEADAGEQQKKIAKLRGSESETVRLKAINEQEHGRVEALEAEIAALKAKLAEAASKPAAAPAANPDAAASKAVRDKDKEITRLQQELKEQAKEIRTLQESVSAWQKKYEFVSTEAPSAYQ
jgi:predicted RNase H-like nuclease (RuvC/YqgF family)